MKDQHDLKYPSIAEFFRGRNVLITGATGFLGKVLIEKLMYSCPDVGTLYLLMRPKRGQQPEQRLKELLTGPVFERVRADRPSSLTRAKVVAGDVSEEGLGVNPDTWAEVLEKCSVVFHCAACVRFDMSLKHAVTFNTLGTKRLLEACSNMTNLESLVYVSTTYCHCEREELGEQTYDPPADPEDIIESVRWMKDELIEALTPQLLGNLPNTYAYSKCLSEKLVADAATHMPVAIARPSIVTGSLSEPTPGYVDNLNGPTGLLLGAGKGVLRSMHCRPSYHADLVPVDLACNGIIITAWHLANQGRKDAALVVNLTASESERISWGEVIEIGRKHIYDYPFSGAVWYPDGSIKNSKLQHELCVTFFHNVPAYLIDLLAVLFRNKPFMVNIQKRLQGGLDLLQYYTTKEWLFTTRKIRQMSGLLSVEERAEFNADVSRVKWDPYLRDIILGTRKFILKDDPATLPKARAHLRRLYWLDRGVRVMFILTLLWLSFCFLQFVSELVTTGVTSPKSLDQFSSHTLMEECST